MTRPTASPPITAEPEEMPWPVEEIPDEARMFVRVHRKSLCGWNGPKHLVPGKVVFRSEDQSCDWCEYASAADTQAGGRQPAEEYFVAVIEAGRARSVEEQEVVHCPVQRTAPQPNRAHSEIRGPKKGTDPAARLVLGRKALWAIPPADDRA